jgi:integrase
LTWQDVDFSGSVKVWRQLEPGKDFRLSELKTKTSRRTLTLDPRVVDALREYREAELYTNPAGIVFTRETGDPLGHSGVRRDYSALLIAAGVPHCRFHDLRHTAASLMLANGVSVSTVAGILGHSSPAVTMRTYAHFIPQYQPAAAKILADLVLSQPIATGQKINTPIDRENAK